MFGFLKRRYEREQAKLLAQNAIAGKALLSAMVAEAQFRGEDTAPFDGVLATIVGHSMNYVKYGALSSFGRRSSNGC